MAKKRKPIWLRILLWVISSILSIVALLGVGCGILYIRYEINVFKVIGQIRILNEEVDYTQIVNNPYTEADLETAKLVTDANVSGLISYTEQDGYSITPEKVTTSILGEVKLTDKQVAAIINNLIMSQDEILIEFGTQVNLKEHGFKLEQVTFSEIDEGKTEFNVVLKIELTKFKEDMNKFPANWIRKGIPDSLYFSATVDILKGDGAFEYSTQGKSLRINNLTNEKTKNIFDTINVLTDFGTVEDFSKTICDVFVNALIGNEATPGIAYALTGVGAEDFDFEKEDTSTYFVIKMQ